MDLGLKNAWTNILDSDWFYYNQTGILLEKSENLLELSVKKLVIRLASWISLGQAMIGVCVKPNIIVCYKVRYFCIQHRFSKSKSNDDMILSQKAS